MKLLDRVDKMLSDDIAKLMVPESLSTQTHQIIERNIFQGDLAKLMVPKSLSTQTRSDH